MFLTNAFKKTQKEIQKLIDVIGESPFRLSKAIAYLKEYSLTTMDEYIEQYAFIKNSQNHNEEIYPEVELLFRDLKKASPESWELLKYLAYLDIEGVPLELINNITKKTDSELQVLVKYLERLSLVNVIIKEDRKILKLSHKIVQDETKKALIEENPFQIQEILQLLFDEVNIVFPKVNENSENWKEALEWIIHAKILIEEAKEKELLGKEVLLEKVGLVYYYINGDFELEKKVIENLRFLDILSTFGRGGAPIINEIILTYHNLTWQQRSFKYLEEALKIRLTQLFDNHPNIADSFTNVGLAYRSLGSNRAIEEKLREFTKVNLCQSILPDATPSMFMKICNKLLNVHEYLHYLLSGVSRQDISKFIDFGNKNKAQEYFKQAYSIYLATLGENHEQTNKNKLYIEEREPDFFKNQGSKSLLTEQECFAGNKVGFEYRWIIFSRGKTDDNLIILKEKLQGILNLIPEGANNNGWNYIDIFSKNEGNKKVFKTILGELGQNEKNLEIVQMLCFEAMNLGIMKSEKKPYKVVENFTKDSPELVKKIAKEHPEFFVDGSIVEACIRAMPDQESKEYIFNHVKYMGMNERRERGFVEI